MFLSKIIINRRTQGFFGLVVRLLCVGALTLFVASPTLWAESFTLKVKHEHIRGSSRGQLVIDDAGVQYHTANPKEDRQWSYTDIQEIQFLSVKKLNLVSYEDSRWRFGGDRIYKFELTEGSIPDALVAFVTSRFPKPISDRLPATTLVPRYEIPVKHLHRVGGCQGKLIIAASGIAFISQDAEDSRFWRYSDLQSVGTSGPYDLRLGTYEQGPLQYGDTKEFRFLLKTKLDKAAYRFVWSQINKLVPFHTDVSDSDKPKDATAPPI